MEISLDQLVGRRVDPQQMTGAVKRQRLDTLETKRSDHLPPAGRAVDPNQLIRIPVKSIKQASLARRKHSDDRETKRTDVMNDPTARLNGHQQIVGAINGINKIFRPTESQRRNTVLRQF